MRSVAMVGRTGASALLLAVLAVGCHGPEASSQERPADPAGPATALISGEGILPGDPSTPGPTTVTTTRRWPIGKGSPRTVTTISTPSTTTPVG
jgi:hypothetical protein